jgi:hypothetical protein
MQWVNGRLEVLTAQCDERSTRACPPTLLLVPLVSASPVKPPVSSTTAAAGRPSDRRAAIWRCCSDSAPAAPATLPSRTMARGACTNDGANARVGSGRLLPAAVSVAGLRAPSASS